MLDVLDFRKHLCSRLPKRPKNNADLDQIASEEAV